MKKLVLALLFTTGMTLAASAQDKKMEVDASSVPQEVKAGFSSKFANATDAEWKKKGDDYMVHFEVDNVEHHAKLNSSGTVVAFGNEIQPNELPQAVTDAVKKDYADYTIDEVYTVIENSTTKYKVNLDGATDRKIIYSADGQMLKDKADD